MPMFDATLVPAALCSLKIILDLVKNVKDAKLSARVVSEVIDLQSKLVGMGQQAVELQEDNRRLIEENAALKKEKDLGDKVAFHDGANWRKRDDGTEEGPFCPSCWSDGRLHRAQVNDVARGAVYFACTRHSAASPYLFTVPESLVKGINLDPHRGSVSFGAVSRPIMKWPESF